MSRLRKIGCAVICYNKTGRGRAAHYRCNEPLALGARLCAKHEADRVRLSVVRRVFVA